MKRLGLMFALLLAALPARAAWADVKAGLDAKAVLEYVGAPILTHRGHSGHWETWTYDNGASVLFENGRVRYWTEPRRTKP